MGLRYTVEITAGARPINPDLVEEAIKGAIPGDVTVKWLRITSVAARQPKLDDPGQQVDPDGNTPEPAPKSGGRRQPSATRPGLDPEADLPFE